MDGVPAFTGMTGIKQANAPPPGFAILIIESESLNMSRVELNVQAPDFSLNDFNGQRVSLSKVIRHKNVMVVFNRGFF